MNSTLHPILTVTLPDIGEGVVEGEVIAWLKQVGDVVKQDEPVVVVMTDKATVELPAPQPGILAKHYFPVGGIALKDKPLYDIAMSGPAVAKVEEPKLEKIQEDKVLASPATRKKAREEGLDINTFEGSGKEGRVVAQDLLKKECLTHATPTPVLRLEGDTEEAFVGMKLKMAEKMLESVRTIPHFTYFEQADLTTLIALKHKIAQEILNEGIKLTYMPFFIKALSGCINKYNLLNSSLDRTKGVIVLHKPHNIGVAMAAPYGLIVPVIKQVEKMSFKELIYAYDDLKKRAFDNKLSSQDMKEGTLTITNFGALQGASIGGTPLINAPEAAICGVARILKMPTVIHNEIMIRDLMTVSFSFDHCLIDGQLAALISSEFCSLLENPSRLL